MLLFNEWPLVLFTLLVQLAVGILLIGECMLRSMDAQNAGQSVNTSIRRQSCFSFAALAVAAIFGLMHTGTPEHTGNAVLNAVFSWPSGEIVILGMFGVSLLWLSMLRIKSEPHNAERMAATLSVIFGLVFIASTAPTYSLPGTPSWSNGAIFFHFFGSTLLLGVFWHGFIAGITHPYLVSNISAEKQPKVLFSSLLMYAFSGFLLIAASLPFMMQPEITGGAGLAGQSAMDGMKVGLIPLSCLAWSLAVHVLLLGLAMLFLGGYVLRVGFLRSWPPALGMGISFLLLLVGEFLGRALIYLPF